MKNMATIYKIEKERDKLLALLILLTSLIFLHLLITLLLREKYWT